MNDEQTNTSDTTGTFSGDALAKDGKPLTDYDKALALVERREKVNQEEKEILDRKEKLAANAMLGGTSGGHVEPKPKPEIDKKEYAKEVLGGKLNVKDK